MSFRSAKLELISYVPELNAVQAGVRLNRAYQHLLAAHPWSFLRKEALINTVAEYTTGTITIPTGSSTVTGASTVWTVTMAGRFLRMGDAMEIHSISAVDAIAQTLTLAQAYTGAAVAASGYSIFQHHYTKPTDCKDIIGIRRNLNMPEKTIEYINTLDPDRESTGEPLWWANFNDTTVEVFPVPDAVYALRVHYMMSVSDASGETDTFLLPERLVIANALLGSYKQLASSPELGAHYVQLTQWAFAEFKELWERAVEDDMRKLSLPTDVGVDGWDFPVSNDFWMKHDVEDPRGPWR